MELRSSGLSRLMAVLLVLVVVFAVAACSQPEPEEPTGDTGETGEPAKPDEGPVDVSEPVYGGHVTVGVAEGMMHIDAQSVNYGGIFEGTQYVYESLFERNGKGEAVPWLAKDYEFAEDGLTLTLFLEEGVTFHDGEPFNAEAVKFNLERKMELKKPLWELIEDVTEISVVDDYTVELKLAKPAPHIIPTLASKTFVMYSPKWVKENSTQTEAGEQVAHGVDEGLSLTAVGTGPFKLKSFEPNVALEVEKYEDYWKDGLPYLDSITVRTVPDNATAALMMENGELDVTEMLMDTDIQRFMTTPDLGVKVITFDSSVQYYIPLNNLHEPLDDKRVRQAFNYAVDKQGMIDTIFLGHGATLAKAPLLTPSIGGYKEVGYYAYDPDKALSLLQEAGYEMGDKDKLFRDGKPLTVDFLTRSGKSKGDYQIAEVVQANLAAVGVNTRLTVIEAATFIWEVTVPHEEAEYEMINLTWGTFTGDAAYPMNMFFHSYAWAPRYYNRCYYANPEVDALIEEARLKPDLEQRNALYQDALELIFDDAPFIQLFQQAFNVAYQDNIGGYATDMVTADGTTGLFPAKFLWKVER